MYSEKAPSMAFRVSLVSAFLILQILSPTDALSTNYYDHTCPQLEATVTAAVKKALVNDHTVPAALLRMHFHDCFIRVYSFLFLSFLTLLFLSIFI